MKAIYGGKTKNDIIDALKIAKFVRGGAFPLAHAYTFAKPDTNWNTVAAYFE